MIRLVAFLRGINVGGHHKLPMVQVRAVLAELGATDVATYIQSGNAVFSMPDAAGDVPRPDVPRSDVPESEVSKRGEIPRSAVPESDVSKLSVLAEQIAVALQARAGFAVPTVVLTAGELAAAREACPFRPVDPRFCHLVFGSELGGEAEFAELVALTSGTDTEVHVDWTLPTVAVLTPGGLSASKPATRILGRLGGTARNLRTVDAMLERV